MASGKAATTRRRLLAGLVAGVCTPRLAKANDVLRVAAVPSADRLELTSGQQVVVAGIVSPGGRPGSLPTHPIAVSARDLVRARLLNQSIRCDETSLDRHGRLRAQVHEGKATWLQALLVEQGLAYVWPDRLAEPTMKRLLALEARARGGALGLWADRSLGEQPAEAVRALPERFAVVTGVVLEAARQQRFLYLNFGDTRNRDFTVRVPVEAGRAFKRAGLDVERLPGQRLRVRGWLFSLNGPMLEAGEPSQVEVLP